MKNKLKLLGIIALAAVIGFSVISCPEPEEKDTGIVGTWVLEMTRSEALEYFAGLMETTVVELEIMLEQSDIVVPAKITSSKFVFTKEICTMYYINMSEIMSAAIFGGEIDWEGLMEEETDFIYSMDGNNLMYGSEIVGKINGNKLTAYDFYDEGENAVFTKK